MDVHIPFKDVLTDESAYQELVREGGKDQVPCLRIDSESGTTWMYESDAIIEYIRKKKSETSSKTQ